MNTDGQVFAVYLTVASAEHPVGYVVNNVQAPSLDTITLVTGQAAVADPDRAWPIGSIYRENT